MKGSSWAILFVKDDFLLFVSICPEISADEVVDPGVDIYLCFVPLVAVQMVGVKDVTPFEEHHILRFDADKVQEKGRPKRLVYEQYFVIGKRTPFDDSKCTQLID